MLPFNPNGLASALSDVVNTAYEYLNLLFLLDANGVYFGAKDLRRDGASLVRLISEMGEIDAAISVASYRAGRTDWCRPRFAAPGAPAVLVDVRHPLLGDAVPNTITLSPSRGVLVTGSNMSGKSTFLRTVGVTAVMAQTITDLPGGRIRRADRQRPELHRTGRRSRGRQELLHRRSRGRARARARQRRSRSPPVPAGRAVPRHQRRRADLRGSGGAPRADWRRRPAEAHVAIAATHDGELVDLLRETFEAYHFGDAVGPDGLVFSHRLQPGPATTRNAIALLRLHGAPERVLARAMSCAAELDRQRGRRSPGDGVVR